MARTKKPKKPPGLSRQDEALRKLPEVQEFERVLKQIMTVTKEEADRRIKEGWTGKRK